MIENSGHQGKIIIQEFADNGIKEQVIYNRVMNDFLNEAITLLTGASSNDHEIKYIAFGTSDTAVSDADTRLGAEVLRKPVVSLNKTDVGKVQSEFTLADTEALVTVKEIGFFCGASATSTANSGRLLSRVLWYKDRTVSPTNIQFKRIDSIERK